MKRKNNKYRLKGLGVTVIVKIKAIKILNKSKNLD